jgi:hypothetical protein
MFDHRLTRALLASLPLFACRSQPDESGAPTQTLDFPISITARSEAQANVAGVEIFLGQQSLGKTDAAGSARLALHGSEGDTLALDVKCPASYASPERPLFVGLRHLGGGSTAARFDVECFSLVHSVVVGLRAENGPRLPILRLKSVVGQTDDQGVAHVLLQASANEQIALTLDTSKSPTLLPQSPTLDFATRDSDELVLLSQKFTLKQAAPRRIVPRAIPRQL